MDERDTAILILSCVVAFLTAWVLCLLRSICLSREWEGNWQSDCERLQDRVARWEELAYRKACEEANTTPASQPKEPTE